MTTPGGSAPSPAARVGRVEERRLYLCTSDRPDLVDFLDACIGGGVDIVQLRDKQLEARALVARARLARRVCAHHGVPMLLNDRPDLALDAEADGVHVGQDDVSPVTARRIVGDERLIGLSTHSPRQCDESRDEPVDYISAGPVNPTPTKPGRAGTGPGYVTYAVRHARRPVFVTGGVTPETIPILARAGARSYVVVRFLTQSEDPRGDARRLRAAIDAALDPVR